MSNNKQTIQTLFKVGYIVGLICGILMCLSIAGIPFGVVCIISAVMSKKLAAQEEWIQKDVVIVLVLSIIGGNIVSLIGAIIALVEMNGKKEDAPQAAEEQPKEEAKAE